MTPRLTSAMFVTGLLRLAEGEGDFGAVLTKGDATAGAIIILLTERGDPAMLLERLLQPDGSYGWAQPLAAAKTEEVDRFLARRRKFDPDCWVVELDVASAERFAAEIRALD